MTIQKIIQKLKEGDREERKAASKELAKIWHSGRKARELLSFLEEIKNFDSIKNIDNQAAFISAVKFPFLALGDKYFSLCKDFILRILQHKSGRLRLAMIHSAEYFIMQFILFRFELDGNKKKSDTLKKHRLLFCQLVEEVEDLVGKYNEPRFKKYKYVDSLPPSVYKSLQMFLANLLRTEDYEDIYREYQYKKYQQDSKKTQEEFEEEFVKNNFILKEKKKWDYYYDAMEYLAGGDTGMARLLLKKAIRLDEDFVAAYMGMTAVYREKGDSDKACEYTNLAYKKTRKVFPKWPQEMRWVILENRQYLRAICDKAILCQKQGKFKEAEKIYRLLLKLNPGDNQGIRYLLAGMFAGLSPEDIDALFDEGNKLQDWSKLEKLLIDQNKKYHFWEEPEF